MAVPSKEFIRVYHFLAAGGHDCIVIFLQLVAMIVLQLRRHIAAT